MQLYDIDESKGYPIPVIVPDDLGDYYLQEEVDAVITTKNTEVAALKTRIKELEGALSLAVAIKDTDDLSGIYRAVNAAREALKEKV